MVASVTRQRIKAHYDDVAGLDESNVNNNHRMYSYIGMDHIYSIRERLCMYTYIQTWNRYITVCPVGDDSEGPDSVPLFRIYVAMLHY